LKQIRNKIGYLAEPFDLLVSFVDEALGVTPGRTASSADLGGSSKYSNENFED
jgi:hypothetical protein